MPHNLADCYQTLDLPLDANKEEVKRAYRELVKVWHPDRFSGDPTLQQKAEEKIKQINAAYDQICRDRSNERLRGHSPTEETRENSQSRASENGRKDSTTERGKDKQESHRHRPPPPIQPTPAPATSRDRRVFKFALAVVILIVIWGMFIRGGDRSSLLTPGTPKADLNVNHRVERTPPANKPPEPRINLPIFEFRVWTDRQGRQLYAKLVDLRADKNGDLWGKFERPDNSTFTYQLNKLSASDVSLLISSSKNAKRSGSVR